MAGVPGALHLHDPARPVAVVTGSLSGIGFASALSLAQRGYDILLHGLDDHGSEAVQRASDALRAAGACAVYVAADLREPEQASRTIIDAARAQWGRIDALICSAGVAAHRPLSDVTEQLWRSVLAVNLLAPFFLAQHAADALAASRGVIIMISSTNALVANRDNAVYDVSKAALNHLVLNLALELRDRGVRVNGVMPGATDTVMLRSWAIDYVGDDASANAVVEAARQRGQLADPNDVGRAVALLVSDDARWMSGALVPVDGGFRLGD